MKTTLSMTLCLGLMALTSLTRSHAQASEPLLRYSLNEGNGVGLRDKGTAQFDLKIGSGLGWSAKGGGLEGGYALGRVRDDGEPSASNADVNGKLGGYGSYTWTGWYKLSELSEKWGVLVDLPAASGNGLRIKFTSRRNDEGNLEAGLAMATVDQADSTAEKGAIWALWEAPYEKVNEWVFFALTVNTMSPEKTEVTWYYGSESEKAEPLGGIFHSDLPPEAFTLGEIRSIWLGEDGEKGSATPVPVGTYFNDFRFYGSKDDQSGALNQKTIEAIREEAISH